MQLSHILFYRGALRGYLAPAARLVLAMFAADVEERARICVETVEPGKKKKRKSTFSKGTYVHLFCDACIFENRRSLPRT